MNKRTLIQDEVVNNLPSKPHGLLNYAMRFGKGRLVCEIIKKNSPEKVLWVTSNADLRDVDIPKEIVTWLGEESLNRFDIVCYQSLGRIEGSYDMIILDEYQHITEANSINLFNKKITYQYILGITGTPPKHLNKRRLLGQLLLAELSSMSIDEAVDHGIIAPYKITTVPVKLNTTDLTVLAGSKTNPFYTTEYKNYAFWDKKIRDLEEKEEPTKFLRIKRANIIYSSESKTQKAREMLRELKGRTMVFSGNIEQARSISTNTYHSKTDDKKFKLFQEGKIDTLSCVNKGGIGATYTNVDNFIIVQTNSNKMGDITQKIGRALVEQGSKYVANIYLIYLQDTVDEEWKNKVLKDFHPENIVELPKK